MFKKTILTSVLAVSSLLLVQESAFALPLSCVGTKDVITKQGRDTITTPVSYDLTTKIDTAMECNLGTVGQDSVSETKPLTVNTEAFFKITSWEFDGKFEAGSTKPATLATFTRDPGSEFLSGSFTLSAAALQYENLMFVFKSGSGTSLVAYLVDPAFGSGTFTTPFVNSVFDLNGGAAQKGISHISVYYSGEGRGSTGAVPEPATAALLALGALGFVTRRRKLAKD